MKAPAEGGGFRSFEAGADDRGKRLDRIVRTLLPGLGLSAVFGALRRGQVRLNGKRVKPDCRVAAGDRIEIAKALLQAEASSVPAARPKKAKNPSSVPEFPPILLETEDFLVLDKPRGALVHGEGSLDEAVKLYLADKLPPSLAFAPGPLHRLDRNTTGVIFFSKSIAGARRFTEALREGRSSKHYLAIVEGVLKDYEFWSDDLVRDGKTKKTGVLRPREKSRAAAPDSGKSRAAFTEVWPLARGKGYTLLRLAIATGRTHQIRSQAAAHGHPLAGDVKYGGRPFPGGYHLHAEELTLFEGEEPPYKPVLTVKAPLPEAFAEQVKRLFGQ